MQRQTRDFSYYNGYQGKYNGYQDNYDGCQENHNRLKKRRRAKRHRRVIFVLIAALIVCFLWNGTNQKTKPGIDGGSWNVSNASTTSQDSQLQAFLPQYPELKKVIENRSEYPAEVIDVFLKNQEALEYLVDYPKEVKRIHRDDIRKELREGGIPLFLQWDKRWGYKAYGSGLIGWTGCGPACLAMASAGLTGSEKWTPASVAEFSEQNGYYTPGAGTSWDLMTSGAAQLGLHSEAMSLSESSMKAQLNSGHVIICSVGPGDFTTTGHYILIRGYDDEGFLVNDPNSRERSEKSWSYDRIASQIKNLWTIGKA